MAVNACRGRWIELLQVSQQIWQRARFKLCAQGWLGRDRGNIQVVYYRLNIMGGATYQQGLAPTCQDGVDRRDGLLLKLGDGIDLLHICYIQEMVGHQGLFLRCDLGRADIQAAIHLARIGGDNFSIKALRQGDAQRAFARGGWTKDDNEGTRSLFCGLLFSCNWSSTPNTDSRACVVVRKAARRGSQTQAQT